MVVIEINFYKHHISYNPCSIPYLGFLTEPSILIEMIDGKNKKNMSR